jgi:ribonuclease Z
MGVDLLYHEATYLNEHTDLASERGHSTAEEAARTALAAKVGQLLLGHFSSRYPNPAPLLREAKEVFEQSELALEGKRFEVSRQESED